MVLRASGACAQERPRTKGACRVSCALGPRAKWGLHKDLGQTYLPILERLLGKPGRLWLTGGQDTGGGGPKESSLV